MRESDAVVFDDGSSHTAVCGTPRPLFAPAADVPIVPPGGRYQPWRRPVTLADVDSVCVTEAVHAISATPATAAVVQEARRASTGAAASG